MTKEVEENKAHILEFIHSDDSEQKLKDHIINKVRLNTVNFVNRKFIILPIIETKLEGII